MVETIKVSYKGKPDLKLDASIKKLIKSINFEWGGQGYNFEEDTRDIIFDKEKL